LVGEVDLALTDSSINWSDYLRIEQKPPINSLITAIVNHYDEENLINALNQSGFSVTRWPSQETMHQNGSTTLLIGVPDSSKASITRIIEDNCSTRNRQAGQMDNKTEIFHFEIDQYLEI
jgi:uncharacterized protein YaaQ